MSFLSVCDLSISLGDFCLDSVSLDIGRGDYVTVMGPTGAGKSILLECIIGFYRPDAGRVVLDGRDITDDPPETRHFGIVYQDYALLPHLSVFQNIEYGLKKVDRDRTRRGEKVRDMAAALQIGHLLDRRPGTLSGGEQQRTALARSLVVEPRLMLMDEPLSALDPKTRYNLRELLRKVLKDRGITVLHVTHDLDDVWKLADRVAVIRRGRVVQYDTLRRVFNRPCNDFIAEFVGADRYRGTLISNNGDGLSVDIGGVRLRTSDAPGGNGCREAVVAIRPENVLISREAPARSENHSVFAAQLEEVQHHGLFSLCVWEAGGTRMRSMQASSTICEMGLEPRQTCYLSIASANVKFAGNGSGMSEDG